MASGIGIGPWLRRDINAPLAAAALGLAAYALFIASPYGVRLMTLGAIYALLVIGYQFIFGHAGALSLSQAGFFGLGAYVTGVLGAVAGWGFAATFPLSLLAPVALALVVAVPVLRLQTHYFALATLGIGQVLLLVAENWRSVTGGANGLSGVPGIVVFGMPVPPGLPLLGFVSAVLVGAAFLAHRLMRGAWGQAFLVLRENPLAGAATGLDGGRLRLAAFLLSALYAGAAGALYAHTLRVVSPESLGFRVMVLCLTMAVIGGQRRIPGAVLGGVLLVAIPEWFRFLAGADLVAYGLVLLAVIVVAPDGAVDTLEQIKNIIFPQRQIDGAPPRAAPAPSRQNSELKPLLEISGLTKHFGGVTALAGVDLSLAAGEILGLIGPNGSGKTTLINLVTGIDRADAGTIKLTGVPINGLPAHEIARRGIARSFQAGTLVDSINALDTVALAARAARGELTFGNALVGRNGAFARAAAQGEAMRLLDRLGIGAAALRACGELPHGTRRRVEIARALALRPCFLLLDEPASGLAADEQRQLARQLIEIAQDGTGILVIEHAMPFLLPVAHRVTCLDHGRVIACGTPEDIRRDGRVVAAYLGIEPEAPLSRV